MSSANATNAPEAVQPAAVPAPPAGSALEAALNRAAAEAEAAAPGPATRKAAPEAPAEDVQTFAASADKDSGAQTAAAMPDEPSRAEQTSPAVQPAPAAGSAPATKAGAGGPPAVSGSGSPAAGNDDGDEEETEEEEDGQGGRMSLMDHLRELRRRLCRALAAAFVGFLICWGFVEPIFDVLTGPLLAVLPEGSNAMYTTLPEAFFTRMYIAFIAGLFVASPYIFYQIWAFISPGLYDEEKGFIIPVAVVSAVFFVAGGLFCYYIVFHYAFSFFMSFTSQDIVAMPKISDYLDFVLKLILAFGFIFEMPIFSFFLSRMGVVTAAKMRGFRRYAVLLTFIVAAILTPPDVVSQLLMVVPMLMLYEGSILVAAIFGKQRKEPAGADDEAGDKDREEEDSFVTPTAGAAAASGEGDAATQAEERPRDQEPVPDAGASPAAEDGTGVNPQSSASWDPRSMPDFDDPADYNDPAAYDDGTAASRTHDDGAAAVRAEGPQEQAEPFDPGVAPELMDETVRTTRRPAPWDPRAMLDGDNAQDGGEPPAQDAATATKQ